MSVNLRTLVQHINEREGTTFRLMRRYSTGEVGAYALVDESGESAVLKWHPDPQRLAAVRTAMAATSRLREVGYPAPAYLHAGVLAEGTYTLQEVLPGAPPATLRPGLLSRLLALNTLQIGMAIESSDTWPYLIADPVLLGGDGFCLLEPMRAYSPETAELLCAAQAYVRAYAGGEFATGDIVHMDFNPANILVADGDVSGIVDWEGCCTGDCAFDLATLLFYAYDDDVAREVLQRRIRGRTSPAALAVYLSHLIVRQVDWSIRHHAASTVARYVRVAQRIVADLDSLCHLPGY